MQEILPAANDDTEIVLRASQEIVSPSELEQRAAENVMRAIKMAMDLMRQGITVNRQPFFTVQIEQLLNFTGTASLWDAQTGVMAQGDIFTSLKDSWAKLSHTSGLETETTFSGLPKATGKIDQKTGQKIVVLSPNSEGSSDFDRDILRSGVAFITVYETGAVRGREPGRPDRALTQEELQELIAIFEDAYLKLNERRPST